ncbi:MAG: imelysin family protein [Flavobacteriales bacterium]
MSKNPDHHHKGWKLPSLVGWRSFAFPLLLLFIALASGCEKDKDLDKDQTSSDGAFDRKAMLENYGENLIIPGYKNLKASVGDLESAASDFTSDPKSSKLQTLQDRLVEAYKDWQTVSVYEFGPAKDVALRSFSNTFPTDTGKIEDNIATGSYDLSDFGTEAEKGFPALDYLLFNPYRGDSAVVNAFSSDANASQRQDYLMDVIADLKGNAQGVLQKWKPSGGDHLSTFVNATGTDVGSSLGLLVNELNYDLEIIKNAEIGIPLGKKSMGNPKPKKCQAYYGVRSKELAITHLKSLRDCYLGKGASGDLRGLDDNLEHIDAEISSGPLHKAIRDQFSKTLDQLKKIPAPLSEAVVNSSSSVEDAYTELKKLVALLKSDMPSELGVQITYQDNDGD